MPYSAPTYVISPALTTASSFGTMSLTHSRSSTMSAHSFDRLNSDDDEDHIVWSVSEGSMSSCSDSESESPSTSGSDSDDFVVLSRPETSVGRYNAVVIRTGLSTPVEDEDPMFSRTPSTVSVDLASQIGTLSVCNDPLEVDQLPINDSGKKAKKAGAAAAQSPSTPKRHRKKAKAAAGAKATIKGAGTSYPSPAPSPTHPSTSLRKVSGGVQSPAGVTASSPKKTKKKSKKKVLPSFEDSRGLGLRAIVDDVSERQSTVGDNDSVGIPSLYDEAATYISSYLSNPEAQTHSVCRLTLLQSLIIELGLATSSLPASLTAAKSFLKSRAFVNVREYLAVRNKGPEAVQGLLYPSRSALIKDIRRTGNRASLRWVKEHGLQVLLVSCFH